MIPLQQNAEPDVPVILLTADRSAELTGSTNPIVYALKSDGTTVHVTSGITWAEIDSTNMPGLYTLKVSPATSVTNLPGFLVVYVQDTVASSDIAKREFVVEGLGYLMRAYHTVSPVGYVYWEVTGAPDTSGADAPYSSDELTDIVTIKIFDV